MPLKLPLKDLHTLKIFLTVLKFPRSLQKDNVQRLVLHFTLLLNLTEHKVNYGPSTTSPI